MNLLEVMLRGATHDGEPLYISTRCLLAAADGYRAGRPQSSNELISSTYRELQHYNRLP